MMEQLEVRINELKAEIEAGQKAVEELETTRTNIIYSLLRISGAIQVLEEFIKKEESVNITE